MSKETETIEKVQLLGHISTLCPYCQKTIYIPKFRVYPRTYEEARRQDREIAKKLIEAEHQ
jgi:hypothetical protein